MESSHYSGTETGLCYTLDLASQKDEDFFHLATRSGASLSLVWVRLGNCRRRELLASVDQTWPRIVACIEAGERIVEIR